MDYPERINAACRQDASNVSQALHAFFNDKYFFVANKKWFAAVRKELLPCI